MTDEQRTIGRLEAKVERLEATVDQLDGKMDRVLAIVEQGKGARMLLGLGAGIASGGVGAWLLGMVRGH